MVDEQEPQREAGRARPQLLSWPLLLLLCGVAVSLRGAQLQDRADHARHREAVRSELEVARGALSRELFAAIHLTEGVAALIATQGSITPDRFQALAAELFRRSHLVRNLVVAPDNVAALVYPVVGNQTIVGLDYRENPLQWPSVERMMREERLVVAGPVQLVQGGIGVIGRRPIYVADEAGGQRYWGLTSTVVDFEELLRRAGLARTGATLEIALRGRDGQGARGTVFWGSRAVFDAAPVLLDVPLPSGSWQLAAIPRGGWRKAHTATSGTFLGGTLISLLLALLLLRLMQAVHARAREVDQRRRAEVALKQSVVELERARSELEERVAERTRELELARDAAESADRLKSAFLATMSHELRTPLNSIIGFTGLLRQGLAGPINEEQTKQLGMVNGSAKHLLALINDVLDLSKIEAGQLRLAHELVDLPALLESCVAALRPEGAKKGLALEATIAPEVTTIHSDGRRVQQVLLNLLSNAVKFTEHGHVRVDATSSDGRVSIAVSDTGPGIARDQLDQLFRPFSQVDSGLDRRHEGTGLGLSICKRLVELLGGTIAVQSLSGKGSVFSIELPSQRALSSPQTSTHVAGQALSDGPTDTRDLHSPQGGRHGTR